MEARNRKILITVLTLLLCIGIDQAAKTAAGNYLPRNEVKLGGGPVVLHYSENRGAEFAFE